MYSYTTLLLLLALAEVFRRCCMVLIAAFTGPLSKIPGPFLMRLTHIPWIFESVRGNIMNVAPQLFKKYGDVVRVGPRVVLFASKDAAQKIIIEEDLLKSPEYEWLRADSKITNLITERDRVAYRQKRRLLSPGFSISYLNGLEPLMLECVQALEETLNLKCKEGNGSAVVDMYAMLSNLTSDVMAATSFGGSFNSVRTNNNRLKQLFLDHLKENAVLTNFPLLKWLPFKHKSSAELDKLTNSIVAKRQSAKDQSKKDLLQIILDTHKSNPESFTEKHVMEEMRLFMIAGSDTTGTSAAFTVLQLVNNPEKLQSLKMEIDTAFPSKDDRISFANTQDLPYLNAVINETLRVMPIVVSGIPRWTTETTIIDNYEIPAGTIATVWVSALFKDPRIWPDAEAFVPERWLGKYKGTEVDRKAYLPFSGASRSCIGQQFALKEMRLALATLVRRYDLTLIPGQSHEMRVHIVPYFTSGKYLVAVKSRD